MEATTVHPFEQDHVPAGIHDRAGDRDPGLVGHVDGGRHDLLRAPMREALALGDIHSKSHSKSAPGEGYVDFAPACCCHQAVFTPIGRKINSRPASPCPKSVSTWSVKQ